MRIRVLGIVLAGGKGTRLYPLTKERAKPAVPFGGKYRIIPIFTKAATMAAATKGIKVMAGSGVDGSTFAHGTQALEFEALVKLAEGYRAGRFRYLDYLDGQHAALEAELEMLDAAREYWNARLAMEWSPATDSGSTAP